MTAPTDTREFLNDTKIDLKSYRKLAAHGNFFAIIANCLNTPGIYEA